MKSENNNKKFSSTELLNFIKLCDFLSINYRVLDKKKLEEIKKDLSTTRFVRSDDDLRITPRRFSINGVKISAEHAEAVGVLEDIFKCQMTCASCCFGFPQDDLQDFDLELIPETYKNRCFVTTFKSLMFNIKLTHNIGDFSKLITDSKYEKQTYAHEYPLNNVSEFIENLTILKSFIQRFKVSAEEYKDAIK